MQIGRKTVDDEVCFVSLTQLEDRPRQCAENIGKAGRLMIRLQR